MTPEEKFDAVAQLYEGILRRRQMMGRPALFLDQRMVACLDGGVLGIRLGRTNPEMAGALEVAGSAVFAPGGKGRQFKDWVGIPAGSAASWDRYLDAAIAARGEA